MSKLVFIVRNALTRLHNEEEGMEAMQTVLIMALATVVLAFAYKMMGGDGTGTGANGGFLGSIGDMISSGIGKFVAKVAGFLN